MSPENKDQIKCIPSMNTTGKLETAEEAKSEVLNNVSASFFTGNLSSYLSGGWTAKRRLGEQSPSDCKR